MKGYSKITLMNTNTKSKSKSIDFSDQTTKPPTPTKYLDDDYDYNKYSGNNNNNIIIINNNNNNNTQEQDEHYPIKINQSAATSQGTTTDASSRFKIQKQHSTGRSLQTAVKRVMSVRRSSSVSERYARIHDQYADYPFDDHVDGVEDVEGEEGMHMHMARSKNTMKRRGNGSILKACKRIFGL